MPLKKIIFVAGLLCISHTNALGEERAASKINSASSQFISASTNPQSEQDNYNRKLLTRANEMIAAEPRNAKLLAGRAQLYFNLRQLTMSLADINAAIALDPSLTDYYGQRAHILNELGQSPKLQLDDLSRCIRLGQPTTDLYRARAAIYANLGQLQRARADADKAVNLDPTNFKALYVRAVILEQLGDFKGAQVDCEKASTIEPSNIKIRKLQNKLLNRH